MRERQSLPARGYLDREDFLGASVGGILGIINRVLNVHDSVTLFGRTQSESDLNNSRLFVDYLHPKVMRIFVDTIRLWRHNQPRLVIDPVITICFLLPRLAPGITFVTLA